MKNHILSAPVIMASHIVMPTHGTLAHRYVLRRSVLRDEEFVSHMQTFDDTVEWMCAFHHGVYNTDFVEAVKEMKARCNAQGLPCTYIPKEQPSRIIVSDSDNRIYDVARKHRLFIQKFVDGPRHMDCLAIFAGAETGGVFDEDQLYIAIRNEKIDVAILKGVE